MTRFEDLVDLDGLDASEQARLRRVHDLLVQAGPPPDLPPALERPPTAPPEADVTPFPMLPRRRWPLFAVAAAAAAVLAFGGGYLTGHAKKKATSFATTFVVPMKGQNALALLRVAPKDDAGNTPMELEVNNLPQQPVKGDYYELWLTRNGRAIVPCGAFRVNARTTTVRLSVPYNFRLFQGWVVTRQTATQHTPGPVVLST
ncbi:MAG: anti-sigma factor domain-containing protein [Gaiellaceae bacterium]